jgi:hypothetical protein
MAVNTVCSECNGDSAENLVGNPVQCEACQDTGKRHEDCGQCGRRFEYESGYDELCAECHAATVREEREPDDDWKRKFDR